MTVADKNLQKGEIPLEDYAKIDQVLSEIGGFTINYRLLKVG